MSKTPYDIRFDVAKLAMESVIAEADTIENDLNRKTRLLETLMSRNWAEDVPVINSLVSQLSNSSSSKIDMNVVNSRSAAMYDFVQNKNGKIENN
jgi:archaellum biogenesis ATPase FlaH